jgi:hypothetical protein
MELQEAKKLIVGSNFMKKKFNYYLKGMGHEIKPLLFYCALLITKKYDKRKDKPF